MMPESGKTVALIDPLWIGHHPMYFSQFTASFLRSGARVIGLCPEPEAAMRDLLSAVDSDTAATLSTRVHFHQLPTGGRSFFNGRFEGDPARTFSRWKRAADMLADAEADSGMKADLVYFPYLDSFLRFLPFAAIPKLVLNRPWSGLYLRNHHHGDSPSPGKSLRMLAKGDAILRSELCRGVGVLDERFIPAMERYTGSSVIAYPDVTQAGLPEKQFETALEISSKARGRKVIGIIGLERRKGFLTLLRTAELARQQGLPYYFVCAGTLGFSQYTVSEQEMIHSLTRRIASGEIDNLHLDPTAGRIPNESDYNSVFLTFNIAWAAYERFQGSSGTLSKAALFEIPCIASTGECIGQRVERYRMGITIPEGNAEAALAAIKELEISDETPRFADYREDHSQARLDRILAELLETV
jgi:hypothetical protein